MKKRWISLLAALLALTILATGALAEFDDMSDLAEVVVEELDEIALPDEEQGEMEESVIPVEEQGEIALGIEDEGTSEFIDSLEYQGYTWGTEDSSYGYEETSSMEAAMAQAFSTYTVQGKRVAANSIDSPGAGQCFAYANQMYRLIWGFGFDESTFLGTEDKGLNMLRNLAESDRTLTAEHIRSFINASELGAVIRITACNPSCPNWNNDGCAAHNYGHNLILVEKNGSGFTTFDNWNAAVRERTWSWDSFCGEMSKKYPNIKYIKWPHAPQYNGQSNEYNAKPEQPILTIAPASDLQSTSFTWESTKNTSYYDIHIRDANGKSIMDDSTGKGTSYTTKLPAGVYYAYVGAVNTYGDEWRSTDSAHIWFGVAENNAIPEKTTLDVSVSDNLHETKLSWNRVANADHYDVHIVDDNNNFVVNESAGVETQYAIKLKSGVYVAYIGAVNAYANEWKWNDSDKVRFTVKNGYQYPEQPILSVKATNDSEDVVFTWNSTKYTSYFDLHLCDSSGKLLSTDSVGKSTTLKKRLNAGTYWAYVGAVNTEVAEWTTNDSEKVKFTVSTYKPVHTHTVVEDKAVAETCTTDGKTAGSHCSVCGAIIIAQKTVPAKGHSLQTMKGKAATCTAAGLTDGSKCSVCGEVLIAQKSIPATDHTPVMDYGYASTCAANGLTDGSHCATCGVVLVAQQPIGMKAHTPVLVPGYLSTYDYPGLTDGSYCAVCGVTLVPQQVIPQLAWPARVLEKNKNNGTVTVNLGEKVRLVPQFAYAAGAEVTGFRSGKAKVAGVDGGGLVTALAEGKAKITVTTSNKKQKATITVVVVDPYKPMGIGIAQGKAITLTMGQPVQLGVGLNPATARATLTWKSNKAKVATVDGNGVVYPVGEGKAKITVTTHNKKKATIAVTVVDPYKPLGVSIAQGKTLTIKVNQTALLSATLNPASAQSALTWQSSKPSVVFVDSNGIIAGVKKGKAKITVMTYNKKKATITVNVVD